MIRHSPYNTYISSLSGTRVTNNRRKKLAMKNGGSFLLLLWIFPCWSSAFAPSSSVALLKSSHQRPKSWLADFLNGDSEVPVAEVSDEAQSLFPTAEFLELEITLHRPLGCTVEESLADHPVEHVVFVSKVSPIN